MAHLTIADTLEALARAAAERIAAVIETAIGRDGEAMVCLTGGTTAGPVYRALASSNGPWRIQWRDVHLFWGDERPVPPAHPDSNYGLAAAILVSRVAVPSSQVHRIRGELPAEEAAMWYERELIRSFAEAGRRDGTFDLVLLGVGADAHIASIFPGSPLMSESVRRAAAASVPSLNTRRITLTPPALLAARHIVTMVAGAGKAQAVAAAIEGPLDERIWPAQLLRRAGDRVEWFIDRAAASALRARPW